MHIFINNVQSKCVVENFPDGLSIIGSLAHYTPLVCCSWLWTEASLLTQAGCRSSDCGSSDAQALMLQKRHFRQACISLLTWPASGALQADLQPA